MSVRRIARRSYSLGASTSSRKAGKHSAARDAAQCPACRVTLSHGNCLNMCCTAYHPAINNEGLIQKLLNLFR